MLLEVIATGPDDVVRACEGGADRIELVAALQEGGLTPSVGLIEEALRHSVIPVHVIVRPHSRSFSYDKYDLDVMIKDIRTVRRAGAAGIVIGALTEYRRVDRGLLQRMLEEAEGLSVTFHRAFDEARNLDEALEDLLAFPQVNRVLTSGGQPSALDAADTIARLVRRTQGTRIRVLAGSGLTVESLPEFIRQTGVQEIHFGRGVRVGGSTDGPVDPDLIRQIKG